MYSFCIKYSNELFENKLLKKCTKEDSKARRPLALILTIVVILGLIIALMTFVIPQLGESISTLVKNVPDYVDSLEKFMNENIKNKEFLSQDIITEVYEKSLINGTKYNKICRSICWKFIFSCSRYN